MEPDKKPSQSRKVDPEEAIATAGKRDELVERIIDNSAYGARSENSSRDYYPVGRKAGSKQDQAERDIDSVTNLSRRADQRKDDEEYIRRNTSVKDRGINSRYR